MTAVKILFSLFLAGWGVYGAFDIDRFGFLNGADLVFHEAGHPIFGLLGEFMGMLGGTLMQLAIPLAVFVSFLKKGDRYGASVMVFWFGQNFFHIANYMKDARTQRLHLVGGGIHDWGYLFERLGVLHLDQQIGTFFWVLGIFFVLGSACLGILSAKTP